VLCVFVRRRFNFAGRLPGDFSIISAIIPLWQFHNGIIDDLDSIDQRIQY
jgi:hypothetical protein